MLNLLEDYIWRSLPEWGDFSTNPNLRNKADEKGKLLPFFGNTVVFLLDAPTKQALSQLQQELYDAAGWMLSEKLDPDTFHVTLHDLVNGPERNAELLQKMAEAEIRAKELLNRWKDQPPLRMTATWMFNMVNTSIVLGLKPADEESWRALEDLYMALETVVPLGYGLTPHITLAYFRPGIYDQNQVQCLHDALRLVERNVTLRMQNLVLQSFSDMNHYETIA